MKPSSDAPDFDALFAATAKRVAAIGYQLTGNASIAEDVLQETFVAVYRNRHRFRGESSIETWVFRIAVNEAKRARRRLRRQPHSTLHAESGRANGGSTASRTSEAAEALHAALDQLPEAQRDALSLLTVRGLSGRVVASVLGAPEGTIYSRAHAARARLRDILGEAFAD